MSFKLSFSRLKASLSKTKSGLVEGVSRVLNVRRKLDAESLEELEEILLKADVGLPATHRILQGLKDKAAKPGSDDPSKVIQLLKEEISDILMSARKAETEWGKGLRVLLMVGVNGTGKTTSIGKLAVRFGKEGKKVLIAACDTFRAAAIEQLTIWAERAEAEIIKSQPKSDPAAVAFDAVQAGLARKADILIIDTAGRLQTNVNLMEELKKIKKVISKLNPVFPQETLLVLDATVGQNALSQVRLFQDSVNPTGIVLTKLDGSAKGGVIIAIAQEFGLPVRYVGLGETAEDLEEFEPQEFVEALFA